MSRAEWGAAPWRTPPHRAAPSERKYFVVHWHGGPARVQRGNAVPQAVEQIHLANPEYWAGIGYNFLVDQDGQAYEGRGWGLVGAHCPGRNRDGIGVYVAVGEGQLASRQALATVKALHAEASERAGRHLITTWHGAHHPTACPGPDLIAWVKAGMPVTTPPAPPAPEPEEPAVALTDDELKAIATAVWAAKFGETDAQGDRESAGDRLARLDALELGLDEVRKAVVDLRASLLP